MLSTIIPNASDGSHPTHVAAAPSSVFSSPVMVNNNKAFDQAAPVSIVASGKELYVVWQDARSGSDDIYASMTYDNGATYPTNIRVDDSVGSSKQIEPAVTVSPNGTILLAWQDNRGSMFDFDIYSTRSSDGGKSYSRNLRVDDSYTKLSWQERPSIAVSSSGIVTVAWTDDRAGPGLLRVRYAYSTDAGATFSRSAEIVSGGKNSGQTGVALTANGNRVFAAFLDNVSGSPHPYLSMSTDGGKTFLSPTRIDSTGNSTALQNGLALAPMPGGGVVVVWEDSRNGDWDIYASIFAADGKEVVSNLRVDDDSTKQIQRDPCVASDQFGNVYAAWEDDRDSMYAIRFSVLGVNKAGFNTSIEVATPGPNDMQRRPSIIAPSPGRVIVIWQDDRSGTYDVYSSSAYFGELFSISLVKGWNFVSIPTVGYTYNASNLGLSNGTIITSWNLETQTYDRTYVVGVSPAGKDFAIVDSTGYMILSPSGGRILLSGNVPTAKQYRMVSVPSGGGWVTIGFESLSVAKYASEVPNMFSTSGSVSIVLSYNPITGTYKGYVPGMPITDYQLVPGQAYWIRCAVAGIFSYIP